MKIVRNIDGTNNAHILPVIACRMTVLEIEGLNHESDNVSVLFFEST
jgi:hypothetical protein